jgi:hypothetical protein
VVGGGGTARSAAHTGDGPQGRWQIASSRGIDCVAASNTTASSPSAMFPKRLTAES